MSARILDVSPTKLVLILAGTFLCSQQRPGSCSIAAEAVEGLEPRDDDPERSDAARRSSTHDEPAARKHAVSQTLLLARALPTDVGMPQIVLQLSRIATEEHVSLDSITPQTPSLVLRLPGASDRRSR